MPEVQIALLGFDLFIHRRAFRITATRHVERVYFIALPNG